MIYVTDMNEILNLGVMSTPGLVIDGKVLYSDRASERTDKKKEG